MPLVSIITPVLPDADDHLVAAYRSILGQQLPPDWDVGVARPHRRRTGPRLAHRVEDPRVHVWAEDTTTARP